MSSSNFTKITDGVVAMNEGGGVAKTQCKYRHKAEFSRPRDPKKNKNHLQTARCCKTFLLVFLIILYVSSFFSQIRMGYNPVAVFTTYYSLWGIGSALFAQIFSIIAIHREGWFKIAYISTEISYAVNSFIMIGFWFVLLPSLLSSQGVDPNKHGNTTAKPPTAAEKWQAFEGVFLHIIPWVATVSDLFQTDLALEKSHWWIGFVTMCPCYMIANWIGSMTMGSFLTQEMGTIYGFEDWNNLPYTLGLFVFCGLIQGGLIYCTGACMDKYNPKRPEEEFNSEGGENEKKEKILEA